MLEGSFDPRPARSPGRVDSIRVAAVLAPARNRCLVCGDSRARTTCSPRSHWGPPRRSACWPRGWSRDWPRRTQRAGPRRQGAPPHLLRQPAGCGPPGALHHLRRPLRPDAPAPGPHPGASAGSRATIDEALTGSSSPWASSAATTLTASATTTRLLPVPCTRIAPGRGRRLRCSTTSPSARATAPRCSIWGWSASATSTSTRTSRRTAASSPRGSGLDRRSSPISAAALLDEMRRRGALSRPMLCYHPGSPSCPDEFEPRADWERRIKSPRGTPATTEGAPLPWLDHAEVPAGITVLNAWRRPKAGGRGPAWSGGFKHLLNRMGGAEPDAERDGGASRLPQPRARCSCPAAARPSQEPHVCSRSTPTCVQLELVRADDRFRCAVCNVRMPWVVDGSPCPTCHGTCGPGPRRRSRGTATSQRILKLDLMPLSGGEHTAQITGDDRIELEEDFKAPRSGRWTDTRSPINVLACSPTLEMGIDVGGLDAVVMRNIPPRPGQLRPARWARRVAARAWASSSATPAARPTTATSSTSPAEMIAGRGARPGHRPRQSRRGRCATCTPSRFGRAEPGLAGRMAEYVDTPRGIDQEEASTSSSRRSQTAVPARQSRWRSTPGARRARAGGAGHDRRRSSAALGELPARIRDLFDRVRLQILKLQETIDRWNELGKGDRSAVHAHGSQAAAPRDPRRRREAERGRRPGQRPSHAPLRRVRDPAGLRVPDRALHAAAAAATTTRRSPITVARRFGIAQYQPEARAHARGHRWRVVGLDLSSPWNPKTSDPDWVYCAARSATCATTRRHAGLSALRLDETLAADTATRATSIGGFLAVRDDTPVLQEEDRFSIARLVACHPQRTGGCCAATAADGLAAELRREEDVRWVNEWKPPTSARDRRRRQALLSTRRGAASTSARAAGGRSRCPRSRGKEGKGREEGPARRSGRPLRARHGLPARRAAARPLRHHHGHPGDDPPALRSPARDSGGATMHAGATHSATRCVPACASSTCSTVRRSSSSSSPLGANGRRGGTPASAP